MLRNMIGPSFDSNKKEIVVFFFLFVFWEILILPADRTIFLKNTKGKLIRKLGPSFDSEKAILQPSFDSTTYMYMRCGVIIWSKFVLLRGYYLV